MDQEKLEIQEQFLRLFTANEAAIRAYVRRLVTTRDDAADVMQGISLVLWKKFAEFDEADGFRKWAFGVARYETLAWRRDKARDRLVLADDVLDMVARESAELEKQLSAQRDALENCLEQLPGEQLQFYEDGKLAASTRCGALAASESGTVWFGTDARATQMWDGRIDELALFDRALTEEEIAALYRTAQEEIARSQ